MFLRLKFTKTDWYRKIKKPDFIRLKQNLNLFHIKRKLPYSFSRQIEDGVA